jgi:hypothetical protein
MKKSVLIAIFILLASLVAVSAISTQDVKKQLERSTYYAKNYESGNINYAQFSVYLNSVEEDLNALLKSDDSKFNNEEISSILGTPKKTNWILSSDLVTEIQTADEFPAWLEKIIYDGEKIQLRLTISPMLYSNQRLVYNSQFSAVFKDLDSSFDIKGGIEEARKLANNFFLDPNIQTANILTEHSTNLEYFMKSYFKQTDKTCEELLTDVFGSENLKSGEKIIAKTYEIQKGDPYYVKAELLFCEECEKINQKNWVRLNFVIENNGREIGFETGQEPTLSQFSNLGVNGIKAELIRVSRVTSDLLDGKNYRAAYSAMKVMEALYSSWDEIIGKEQDKTKQLEAYIDKSQFTKGLFEGYKLIATSFNNQVIFEKTLFRELESNATEICTNKIDDNSNEQIDCEDSFCTGQVCGTKTINITGKNQTYEQTLELYCISGICQEKEETKTEPPATTPPPTIECPEYAPLQCNGQVLSKGESANGCPLEPICIEKKLSCSLDSDCAQPLCGKSQCIEGECKITLDQCSQPQCTDGETKSQLCSTGEKITTDVCSNQVWKKTNEECVTVIETIEPPISTPKIPPKTTIATPDITAESSSSSISSGTTSASSATFKPECILASDCSLSGRVCDLGICKTLSANTIKKPQKVLASDYEGTTITGSVIKINGDLITSSGVTGVVGPQPSADEINTASIPQRTYNGEEAISPVTGIVQNLENEVPEVVDVNPISEEELFSGSSAIPGIKEEFSIVGVCKEGRDKTETSFYFKAAGQKFGGISTLMDRYRENGIERCEKELKLLLDQRKEIVSSFNPDFASWFFEEYLSNNANNWESKRQAIKGIYLVIAKNQMQTAKMMDCLSLKELSEYPLISIDYSTDYGRLKYSELVEPTLIPGMKMSSNIIAPSMQTSIFLPSEFIVKESTTAMNAHNFPGSSENDNERKINKGLTVLEMQKFKEDKEINSLIKKLLPNYKDGYLDAQVTFVDTDKNGEKTVVYNIYARINEENFLMEAMPAGETPQVDAKIVVDYNALYSLMATSAKNIEETQTLQAPWKSRSFSVFQIPGLIGNWIKSQLRLSNLMNSLEIQPNNKDINDLFGKVLFLMVEN